MRVLPFECKMTCCRASSSSSLGKTQTVALYQYVLYHSRLIEGILEAGKFLLMKFRILSFGILLTIAVRTPSSTNKESRFQYLESEIHRLSWIGSRWTTECSIKIFCNFYSGRWRFEEENLFFNSVCGITVHYNVFKRTSVLKKL